jgi:hypothetical protein
MNRKQIVIGVLFFVLMIVMVTPTWAQESETCPHPLVAYLAEQTGATCEEIVALNAEGVGYGQMMKAALIADTVGDGSVEWTELLATFQEGIGWGQISRAYILAERYSDLGLSADDLLALRAEEMGWGQIMQAQALGNADLGVAFDEAVAMMQAGMGWGEVRTELGLEAGPPPWAGPDHNNGIGNGHNNDDSNNNGQGNGHGKGH